MRKRYPLFVRSIWANFWCLRELERGTYFIDTYLGSLLGKSHGFDDWHLHHLKFCIGCDAKRLFFLRENWKPNNKFWAKGAGE